MLKMFLIYYFFSFSDITETGQTTFTIIQMSSLMMLTRLAQLFGLQLLRRVLRPQLLITAVSENKFITEILKFVYSGN